VAEIITDAELIKQFTEKVMEEPEAIIETRAPSDTEVELPGGFIDSKGELFTTAEVKELTGADEEAIAKAGSTGKALNVLLQRGLAKIGPNQATKEDLDTLLSGDRDAILLGIRRATFGPTLDLQTRCLSCGDEAVTAVHLLDDIPVVKLKDPAEDREFVVSTKIGEATVALPNGIVQKKLMEFIEKTAAEVNTLLLSGCIVSLDGYPSVGASTALSLNMADRNKIIDEIVTRNPGPRLGEVKKPCKACGEDMSLPLSLLDLFRI